jgi:hypothetical protein
VIVFCLLVGALVTGHVNAVEIDTNKSYVVIGEQTNEALITSNVTVTQNNQTGNVTVMFPGPKEFADRRIDQGACVEMGETIDIAGIGWYSGVIVYYGRYYTGYSGAGNLSMESTYNIKPTDLDHLYIAPEFFWNRTGYWYGYDPFTDVIDSHGNDRIFHVESSCALSPKENATEVSEALNESRIRAGIRANLSRLTQKTIEGTDLIIGRNTTVPYDAPRDSHAWIFGSSGDDTYYDIKSWNETPFTKSLVNDLLAGEYDVVFVSPGNNTVIEEIYDPHLENIYSPFRNTPNASVVGYLPTITERILLDRINSTDDKASKIHIVVEDPAIDIRKLDRADLPNNKSMIILSGYTNSFIGDSIVVQIDADKINGVTKYYSTWKTEVISNGGYGAYRTWNASLIVDFNNVFPGSHLLTVTSGSGGIASVPIYTRKEVADHYVPPTHIEYFDNSPFIPPIYINTTITIPVPGPTKIIIEKIKPTEKEINNAGTAVATVWYLISVIIVSVTYFLYRLTRWALSIYRRAKFAEGV